MNLDRLFAPRSIAVVGASGNPSRIGGRLLKYLQAHGYEGNIVPVNPKYDQINGQRCYSRLGDIHPAPDVVLVAVPAGAVLSVLEEAQSCHIYNAVVYSSGFSETGAAGRQEQLAALATAGQMAICGPNCVGIINFRDHVAMSFSQFLETSTLRTGNVAFISQSGALGGSILNRAADNHIGFSHFVSTGNEAVLEAADFIEYFVDHAQVKVIVCLLEGVRKADKFIHAAQRSKAAGKPLLVMKLGRTAAGAKAASSHTGSMAGSDAVFEAVFKQTGIIRVDEMDDLYQIGGAMAKSRPVRGAGIGVITSTGGGGIILSDKLVANGLLLPELSAEAARQLNDLVPPYVAVANPLDLTAQLINDPGLFQKVIDIFTADENFDAVLIAASMVAGDLSRKRAEYIIAAAEKTTKPVLTWWAAGSLAGPGMTLLQDSHVPFFTSADQCIKALKALYRNGRQLSLEPVHSGPALSADDRQTVQETFERAGLCLREDDAKRILAAYGIPVVSEKMGRKLDEVRTIAAELGYPVVLKVVADAIAHKTEVGGVRLNIGDEAELTKAYEELCSTVGRKAPEARIAGVLVQHMAPPGMEVIIGVKKDPQFGHMLLYGSGGVWVEVFRDFALRRPPLSWEEALEMMRETKGFALLEGHRGKPPHDIAAVQRVLMAMGRLAVDWQDRFEEIDINPLMVFPEGEGAQVLDCLIVK